MGRILLQALKGLPRGSRFYRPGPLHLPYLVVSGAGWEKVDSPAYRREGLRRDTSEVFLQYTLSGRGFFTRQGRVHEVPQGWAFLATAPSEHAYWFDPQDDHWEFLWFNLTGTDAFTHWNALLEAQGPVVRLDPEGKALEFAAGVFRRVLESGFTPPALHSLFAYELVLALHAELRTGRTPAGAGSRVLEKSLAYIHGHYARPLTLKELAERAGLSKYHYCRAFHRLVDATPMEYLRKLRVRRAMKALRETSKPLETVAVECGFSSANYMAKIFRTETGQSPGGYRRRARPDGTGPGDAGPQSTRQLTEIPSPDSPFSKRVR